jgi:histidyl-tRNA synthetase
MSTDIHKVEPATLSGFMELLPAEQMLFNRMLDSIRETYELFGFIPLDTPLLEKAEVLLAKGGGETEKQIYRFQKGDKDIALRFDLTIPLARYVAEHYGDLQFPFRRYHIGKVYRGERAQKGRYREFYQCDIDIIGNESLDLINDAEVPSVIYATFRKLGFEKFTIRINNRKILNGFFESQGVADKKTDVLRIIDKLEKIGADGVQKELLELGLLQNVAQNVLSFVNISGTNEEIISALKALGIHNPYFTAGIVELHEVVDAMYRFGVPKENVAIDLAIARGLDYYTGTVYETVLNDRPEIGSVCSGGRYDNLAECYTNRKLPGVGISIGLTRLFSQLLDAQMIEPKEATPARVLVIPLEGAQDRAIEVAATLRKEHIPTSIYLEQNKSAKAFKYADRLGIPFAITIGEDEMREGVVALKNMQNAHQVKCTIEKVVEIVRSTKT